MILFWIAGLIDPGIMKRNLDCFGASQLNLKLIHKGYYKTTKICQTCNIVRPFRTSHCSQCDNCILRFDHHCPWLGACIGKRNYIFFYFYLMLLNLNNIFILFLSIFDIFYEYHNYNSRNVKSSISFLNYLPSIITIIFLFSIMFFSTKLFFFHTKLIIVNKTSKEELKKLVYSKIGNPYDRGICYNCIDFFCRKQKEAPMYVLKQLRKKGKFPISSPSPFESNSKNKKYQNKLLEDNQQLLGFDIENNGNYFGDNEKKELYSMVDGNKKIYHAKKNSDLKNVESNHFGIIDISE